MYNATIRPDFAKQETYTASCLQSKKAGNLLSKKTAQQLSGKIAE
jgi:hypothetical protein